MVKESCIITMPKVPKTGDIMTIADSLKVHSHLDEISIPD